MIKKSIMPVSPFQPEKKSRIQFPDQGNLSKDLISRWVSITAMVIFFFPLTVTVILFNGGGIGLILTAMISIVLVTTTNLWVSLSKYKITGFGIGVCIDLGIIITSFVIK
jgi:hypothetical protein